MQGNEWEKGRKNSKVKQNPGDQISKSEKTDRKNNQKIESENRVRKNRQKIKSEKTDRKNNQKIESENIR